MREALQDRTDVVLAYVTGRDFALARQGIDEHDLPPPDVLVCDVGTSVYHAGAGGFVLDEGYRGTMAAAFADTSPGDIRNALGEIADIEPQEDEKQAEFKISYYMTDRLETAIVDRAKACLSRLGATASLVHSHDVETGRGLLDVLPAGVAKDHAIRYLHDHAGVDDKHLVYAGDSGNDRAAMLAGYRAIVVANAAESFKVDLRRGAAGANLTDLIYFAREPFAGGVLEGCRHFGLL